jgi:acyl-CoA synthetase (AMP-forming)/AMP-acid ligase II
VRYSGRMRLHDFLDFHSREGPGATFAVHGDRAMTYGQAFEEANRLANAFTGAGLHVGDRIAFLSKNSIEHLLVYFAGSKAGVVPVPLNFRLLPSDWTDLVNDARAKLFIVSDEYVTAVNEIRSDLSTVAQYVSLDGPTRPGWTDGRSWASSHPSSPPARPVTAAEDVYQMYTSGTTGRPKGAVLTQGAVTAHLLQVAFALQGRPRQRTLVVTPLFHAHAAIHAFMSVYWGGCLHIQHEFKPVEFVRALSEERIDVAVLVPSMIQACLLSVPDVATRRYDDLRLIFYGASPIAEHTLRRAIEVFGCDFAQGYGMTETTATLTFLSPADHRRGLGGRPELLTSAGRTAVGTELRVVDEHDVPVPPGVTGQIVARGPTVMRGYWNRPAESAEALRGGWMHTGDLGRLDTDGYLYVLDRIKDMICSGGENIYPRAVEAVLSMHPAIAETAVIGVPDAQWGETVKAIIALRPGATTSEHEIIDFCRSRLAGFQRPRSVAFVETLPRNASGKVLKHVLRQPYWVGRERRVGGA